MKSTTLNALTILHEITRKVNKYNGLRCADTIDFEHVECPQCGEWFIPGSGAGHQ